MPSLDFSQNFHHEVKSCDRFIRNRDRIQRHFQGVPKDSVSANTDAIIDQKLYSRSDEMYKRLVASTLSLHQGNESWVPQWPVKPRPNPLLHSPHIVLDLPNIRNNLFGTNIMDWSVTNYLTVAFPKSVYLWHCPTNRTLKIETKNTSCLKWNPEGTGLFVASRNGTFKYTDVNADEDVTNANRSPCHLRCFITSVAFHPTAPLMFIGCSMGSVCAFHINKGLHIITSILKLEEPSEEPSIVNMRLSCDGRHLAMASLTETVYIYDTINFAYLFSISMSGPSKALEWHPWKRNLLVVSDCHGVMALYDVMAPDVPLAMYLPTVNSCIVNIAFNPVSAELVVSHNIFGEGEDGMELNVRCTSQLNVLSSFDRVVDRMEGHTDAVFFLNWNSDGTQLATAGADETVRIWDFLPHKLKQRTKKKSCKLNYVSASLEIGSRMGLAIR